MLFTGKDKYTMYQDNLKKINKSKIWQLKNKIFPSGVTQIEYWVSAGSEKRFIAL